MVPAGARQCQSHNLPQKVREMEQKQGLGGLELCGCTEWNWPAHLRQCGPACIDHTVEWAYHKAQPGAYLK